MGEVYKARDTRLDRTVAVKVLPPALAEDPEFRRRFDREARTISQLTHPHICTLYDVGDSFLVMEYLEGETLADRLARGALPVDEVVRIARQIADALDKAHHAGIIHRDLKPGNVMLTKTGAKLLDFGLAKPGVTHGFQSRVAGATLASTPTMTTPPNLTGQGAVFTARPYYFTQGRNFDISPDGQRFLMLKELPQPASDVNTPTTINVVLNWFEELKSRVGQ
jgi:serine/threonine protein kinase